MTTQYKCPLCGLLSDSFISEVEHVCKEVAQDVVDEVKKVEGKVLGPDEDAPAADTPPVEPTPQPPLAA